MRAKDFVPASKPRNFVAKNQQTAGAGAHKDKKKAEKQGEFKHKKEKIPMEGRHGYDDMGNSLAPGHDEGEPVYNPRYDVVGKGNDRHWQPDRDQYKPQREKKGFVFYNVSDPDLASQVGLKQTKGGKWYAFTTDRFLNKSAEREFGPGKVWYPKD
jgi:hypothetical protein